MKKAILVVLVFIIMQVVVPIVATYLFGAYDMSFGKTGKVAEQISNPYVLSGMMLVSYVLIVAALYGWRLLSPSAGLVRRNRLLPLAVVIMVLAIVPMSYVEELLDLNDATGGSVKMLMYNPLGVFCITIIGPVVEELVFRRAFLGSLLEKNIKPVIAVPTSVGYGANFHGVSALLTMINSCANGIATVNIDNGYGAGYIAAQINRLAAAEA